MSRRLLVIGVVVVILLGAAGFGAAYALSRAGQSSTANLGPVVVPTPVIHPPSTATATGPGTGQTNNVRGVLGVIQSLNNQTIVITMLRGNRSVTVTVSVSTKYSTLESLASFSDLKIGQAVDAIGQFNPQAQTLIALRVILLPPLGRVTAINAAALTLMTVAGKTVQLNTSSSTIVYVALGLRSIPVSTKAIAVGQILGYEGTTASDGSVGAAKLWLIGLPSARGTVTSVNSTMLTIHTAAGASITVNLGPNTTYIQGPLKKTLVASSAQAIQVGGTVAVTADRQLASGTSTAVLVIVVAA